jgi:hypothetical protein
MEDYMTSRNLKLGVFSTKDGALVSSLDVCGDADDLFVDPKRHRVYVSCGDGFLDVLDAEGAHTSASRTFRRFSERGRRSSSQSWTGCCSP